MRGLLIGLLGSATCLAGCSSDVPLGSWWRNSGGASAGGGSTSVGGNNGGGSGGDVLASGGVSEGGAGGSPTGFRLCGVDGVLSNVNEPGTDEPGTADVTVTWSHWQWPDVHDSMEWDLEVESEFDSDGYFWAHQFAFQTLQLGFVGLQSRGTYDALSGAISISNMVVFWISGPPLESETGELTPARAKYDAVRQWWTINARYDFEPCRVYRLKVARDEEASSGVWYAAWVTDVEAADTKRIGRFLVPTTWGRLAETSSMFSNRIGHARMLRCSDAEPASARFGFPAANDGQMRPLSLTPENVFDPLHCPSSRFETLPNGVRHVLAAPE